MNLTSLVRYFRGYLSPVVAATVISFFAVTLEATSLVLLVALANSVTSDSTTIDEAIGPLDLSLDPDAVLVLLPITVLLSVALLLLTNYIRVRASTAWTLDRKKRIVEAFVDADWATQSADRAGQLQTLSGWAGSGGSILSGLGIMARAAISVTVLLGSAVVVNLAAAAAILLVGTILFVGLRPLVRRIKWWSRRVAMYGREQNAELGSMSEMATEIRIYRSGPVFRERLGELFDVTRHAQVRLGTINSSTSPIYQGTALLLLVVALGIASQTSALGIGELGVVTLLVLRSISYGQQLQSSYNGVQSSIPTLELLDHALADLHERDIQDGDLDTPPVETVEIRDVSFSYEPGSPALEHISCTLKRGEIVGLVGPSGSGKSTLAHILLRLREPSLGLLAANGTPVGELSLESWYKQVAFVPQEPQLFHGTAFDNIAFFRSDLGPAEVEAAARAAGIHDTILELESGYQTELGRAARNLSGGQIQRVGIARALAGEPTVVVLDEPTSALDQPTEALIQDTLERLRRKAIVVVITHRMTTLSSCDKVLVLDEGNLVAEGSLTAVARESDFVRVAVEAGRIPL